MNDNTFVKDYRSILNWGWYKKPLTAHLFRHLILIANIEKGEFQGITINRGQLFTSLPSLASQTGLTINEVRTALKHLISTGEITDQPMPHGRLISVVSYSKYQDKPTGKRTGNAQASHRQGTDGAHQYKNIRIDTNVSKEEKKDAAPATPDGGGRAEWEIRQKVPDMFIGQFESEEAYLSLMSGEGYDPH